MILFTYRYTCTDCLQTWQAVRAYPPFPPDCEQLCPTCDTPTEPEDWQLENTECKSTSPAPRCKP